LVGKKRGPASTNGIIEARLWRGPSGVITNKAWNWGGGEKKQQKGERIFQKSERAILDDWGEEGGGGLPKGKKRFIQVIERRRAIAKVKRQSGQEVFLIPEGGGGDRGQGYGIRETP